MGRGGLIGPFRRIPIRAAATRTETTRAPLSWCALGERFQCAQASSFCWVFWPWLAPDESGKYTLVYSSNHAGAETGEYAVSISTFKPADTDSEPPTAAVPEKVPARYNLQTELKVRVEAGKNVIDFKLEDGPVIQPSDAEEKRENQSILRPC